MYHALYYLTGHGIRMHEMRKPQLQYVSHPPEKCTYFYEDQTNFTENLCPLIT